MTADMRFSGHHIICKEHFIALSGLGIHDLTLLQVQLSDGHTDYLIDALALHAHMHLLRPLFADPNVLKVRSQS